MSRPKLVLVVIGVAAWASVAQAAAVIEITALTPESPPGGDYMWGTTVEFEVSISTDADTPILLRLVTLAFHDSSPELTFLSPFTWDYHSLLTFSLYGENPDPPLENITYSGTRPIPGLILEVPVGGSLVLGTMSVVLPTDFFGPFVYYVDALNADSPDELLNDTARIDFDFETPTTWAANGFGDDVITGEPLALRMIVPDPGTLMLLVVGGLVGLARRRARG